MANDAEPLIDDPTAPLPPADERPRMPEPPPVRLVAVSDVALPAIAGLEKQMDALYASLLRFERDRGETGLVYRAENFRVRFDTKEPLIERDGYRMLQVEVPSLADTEKALIDAEVEYARERGLTPGAECLVLRDPSGNWVQIVEFRRVM